MMKFRFFWTWDHSMDWAPAEPGTVPYGCNNPYKKRPQAFLKDYKLAVDYASTHGINAIIIWGFLRSAHGGVKSSQDLCKYAKDRGVYIWPGIGTSQYGGFYYKSNHPFNAETWLKKHPELRGIQKNGEPAGLDDLWLCHSKEENKEWLRKGTLWLYENFEVGGLNLEYGDWNACYCRDCVEARENIQSGYAGEPDYYKSMVLSIQPVVETAFEMDPDTLVTYATYTGFNLNMVKNPPSFIKSLPEKAVCMWTLTDMMDEEWPQELRPPTKRSIGYTHWGSQWMNNTRHSFILKHIQLICRLGSQAGLEGIGIQGEVSPRVVPNELNYLALVYFSTHPNHNLEDFAENVLTDFFGRAAPASSLLEYLGIGNPFSAKTLQEVKALYTHQADGEAKERWRWLLSQVRTRCFST